MMKTQKFGVYIVIVAVAVIIIIVAITTSKPKSLDYSVSPYNSSVSALLLSNWVNNSIFVYTGVNDSEIGLYGLPSIYHIMIGKYGLLHDKLYFFGGNTTKVELTLNNQIFINRTNSTDLISTPFGSNAIIIQQNSTGMNRFMFQLKGNDSYKFTSNTLVISQNPTIYIYAPNSSFNVSSNVNNTYIYINGEKTSYLEISFSSVNKSMQDLMLQNNKYIRRWLTDSNNISLGGSFLTEYYTSLLLVKDDQNPVTGEFTASPSPIYMYAWVRDGSFAAMALQDAGHLNSAEKYWEWMASVQDNGTWYTRYNFWTSTPDTSYAISEYDSVGLFQLGVSSLYNITHNQTLIKQFLPEINKSLYWEESNINKNKILPQDLSIWEDVMAYNFWTQAMDLLGMRQSAYIFSVFGINSSNITHYANILNSTIQTDYYNGSMYAEYVTPASAYVNGSVKTVLSPTLIADSSSILPIAFGLVGIDSQQAKNDVSSMIKALDIEGGLARFTGDTYHYTDTLHDSSGPMPPWVITTLFLAYYDEKDGNYTGAFSLMKWSIEHSQNMLLPEAVDPNYNRPLITTSPLTWSSAMYIITSLNYKN